MKRKAVWTLFLIPEVFHRYLSLILIVACVATLAGLFAVPSPASAAVVGTPTIVAVDISPSTVWQGRIVTLSYTINNPGSTNVNIILAAMGMLRSPYYENKDTVNQIVISASPGTATYTRAFQVQPDAPAGSYIMYWSIWNEDVSVQYGWTYRNDALTVVVAPTITICFDDGYTAIYQNGYPLMNSFGFQATVFQITGLTTFGGSDLMSLAQLQALKAAGWEIASHTVDHISLVGLSQADLVTELANSKAWLETNGFGPVNALAYPFGQADANVENTAMNYYKYGRTIVPGINDYGIPNKALNTTSLWGNSGYNSLGEVESYVNQAVAANKWVIVTLHGVSVDPNDSRVGSTYGWSSSDIFSAFLQFVAGTGAPVKTFAQMEGGATTNHAPVANADSYATNKNATLNVAAPGVLANDTDSDGDTLTASVVSVPSHGTLTLNANGSFSYVPATGYYGSDSFIYKASDGKAFSSSATVALTINNVNNAPVAVDDAFSVVKDTVLTVAAPGVLGNDTDVDGDSLTAAKVTNPAHGAVVFNSNGSFTYTPASGFSGTDTFTYVANDSHVNSNTATVTITVTLPPGASSTFGLDSGTVTFYDGSDKIEAQRFQNTAGDGTLTKLEVFIDTAYGGKVRMAVYADENGAPGALLIDAGEAVVTNGWVGISGLNLPVTGNTYYWLVFNMSYANKVQAAPSAGNTHLWVNRGYGAFPSTFPSSDGVTQGYLVMRATVTK